MQQEIKKSTIKTKSASVTKDHYYSFVDQILILQCVITFFFKIKDKNTRFVFQIGI